MFFPYSDDNPTERFPFVNLTLIGANVLVFVVAFTSKNYDEFLHAYGYYAAAPRLTAMLTSAFLHAGVEHLVGNMWFLWLYGDNVEDRLGHFFYLFFYLASAVAAAILQTLLSTGGGDSVPMVGASGAVAGVLAAYLIFHPWAKINFFYWIFFFYAGVVQIPAFLVIGLWFAGQFALALLTHGQAAGIAYWAHLGGFGLGLAAAGLLRAAGWVGRPRDILLQGTESFRRALTSDPRPAAIPDRPAPLGERMREGLKVSRTTVEQDRLQKAKQLLIRLIEARDLKQLPRYYSLFERRWPSQSLPERQQWQAGELLREAGRDVLALEAYRKVADGFPEGSYWASACLHAGRLYYLHRNYVRARHYLEALLRQRPAAGEADEARAELKRIEKTLATTAVDGGDSAESDARRYWVLRQTFERIDSSRVGDLVAEATGESKIDARARVARGQGIVAEGLSRGAAQAIGARLQAEGIPVLIAREDRLLAFPPAEEVRTGVLSDSGAIFRTFNQEYAFAWDKLWLISCVRLRIEEERPSMNATVYPVQGRFYAGYTPRATHTESKRIRVLDLFVSEPATNLRILENRFRYNLAGGVESPGQAANFTALVKELVHRAPQAHVGPGVDRLLSEDSFTGLTFDQARELDRFHFWLVQLCHLRPEPYREN